MNPEPPRLIIAGGDDAPMFRAAADRQRPATQARIVAHFDRRVETIAIAVDDFSRERYRGRAGRRREGIGGGRFARAQGERYCTKIQYSFQAADAPTDLSRAEKRHRLVELTPLFVQRLRRGCRFFDERCARLLTSLATTAKPRPCSPARAASTAAFNARMLVWKAIPLMIPVMSAILVERSLICVIVSTTFSTTPLPARAGA